MARKHLSEAERQQTRSAILDAARDLFIERGLEAVTMREIARRVGYSPTAIYLHFKDKEALILELCASDFLALADGLKAILQVTDPVERLRQLGQGYLRFALQNRNHYRLMFMTPNFASKANKAALEQGNPEQDAYAGLKLIVAAAHAAGCFRAELDDPELIAQTLWGGLHGVCALEITLNDDCWIDWCDIDARAGLMLDVLLRGLLRT